MKTPETDIPGDLIEHLTSRAAVLSDMYRQLSDPAVAGRVITTFATGDVKAHQSFLDGLKPDRWPLGRQDLCIRVLDYVKREITRVGPVVTVWVIRDLTEVDQWRFLLLTWRAQRQGQDTTTRQAMVKVPPSQVAVSRMVVPDGPYRDALEAAGFLEKASEQLLEVFEINWPTGGTVTLCLP